MIMANQHDLLRERSSGPGTVQFSHRHLRPVSAAGSGLRQNREGEETPLGTERGRRATPTFQQSGRSGASWTIWALGEGVFIYAIPLGVAPRGATWRPADA